MHKINLFMADLILRFNNKNLHLYFVMQIAYFAPTFKIN